MRTKKKIFAIITIAAFILTMIGAQSTAEAGPPETAKVIISFHEAPGAAEAALIRGAGGSVKYEYSIIPAMAASIPERAIAGLSRNPKIKLIEADAEIFLLDAELGNTWGVKRIGAGEVHAGGNSGEGIKVAVIDTGVDCTHIELAGSCAGGYDFVNGDNDPADDHGHGTHVAGTIAAAKNGIGVVGAAPEAKIFAYKILDQNGSGYMSDAIKALEYAANAGVQVTNNSYSSSGYNQAVEDAFNYTAAQGMIHVAAAGNSGNRPGIGDNVGYPARYDSVIAVAATDNKDKRASFSSTGPAVEISAPGVGINSTVLGGGYASYSGTSMASPHVAGTVALMLKAGIAAGDVRGALRDTAIDLGATGRDNLYGYGLVNAAAFAAVTPPPAPDPAVYVSLATDKTNYISGVDNTVLLAAIVTDENSDSIIGLESTAFVAKLNDSPINISFIETSVAGTYAANLDITAFSEGSYALEVVVIDSQDIEGTGSASFTIEQADPNDPTDPTTVSVTSISYSTSGGRLNDRHLSVTVEAKDDFGSAVAGASISIILTNDSGRSWTGSGTTGTNGTYTFAVNNAPNGCYETEVSGLTASGLTWDGKTPANEFCK